MAYTEQLKRAQLAKLKQRYLDLIEEAGRDKQRAEEENETEKKQLYAEHMLQLRDLPQQLAAEGKSGGMNDSALRGIELAYREGLDALQRMQQQYLDDYSYEVRKQNRLMQLAVDEYLARVASAGKKSSSKKSTQKSSSTTNVDVDVDVSDTQGVTGLQPARSRQRMESLVIPPASGSGWRTLESK